ncbi:MAG TPA: protein kinase [Acidobacteriota bacterium]|nr:protein kinase [Acidobacteriota bacterium]
MIGQTISHYTITAKLGAGGMGEVYLATDTTLDRPVALKFLPESLQRDSEARERLIREAKAASKLNHPNILTIHAVEEADGRDFIVMEFVEGQPLKELIAGGDLDICRIIETAIQIGEGLAAAHEAGIVHRDIKSDNIIVSAKDKIKIMDFGLATWRGATRLTQEGSTVGTMAYMSPEQAQGRPVDHRSDLWSLGVVLYELVTRRMPFTGDHQAAVTYAIANETPHPLERYSADVPEGLQHIVGKCLAKDRDERYQSAADLVADLRALRRFSSVGGKPPRQRARKRSGLIATLVVLGVAVIAATVALMPRLFAPTETATETERKMLAVLPFENLGEEDDEYFADGITEEITARLAGIGGMGVIARTSILQYKGTQKSIQQIGRELGVDYILEGTIRWQKSPDAPDRVRVTPQLISVSDATHLWADVYDEVLTGVFQVQGDIAAKVVDALNLTLLEPQRAALAQAPTDNLEAYDAFLRGNEFFNQGFTIENPMRLAAQFYRKAIALDPDFTAAQARLGRAYIELYWHQGQQPEFLAQADSALARAIARDPDHPDVQLARGSYYYHAGEFDRALEMLTDARQQFPNSSDILAEIGYVLRRRGNMHDAAAVLVHAVELDPRAAAKIGLLADTYGRMRRYAEARRCAEEAIAVAPDVELPYAMGAWLHIMENGDTAAARRVASDARRVTTRTPAFTQIWVLIYRLIGDNQAALAVLPAGFPGSPGFAYIESAAIYADLGDTNRARACYDTARVVTEEYAHSRPNNALAHNDLATIYAGLGLADMARNELRIVDSLAPLAQDYISNVELASNVARVYTMIGDYEPAIDRLELLLDSPAMMSRQTIRLNPFFRDLRDHPRFQELARRADRVF